jgi:Peptidase A4 family/Neprosin
VKRIFKVEAAVAALMVPLALAVPATASPLPAITVKYTGNWTGYGDVGGSYNNVGAVWAVPSIPATKSTANAYFAVGLGGDGGGNWLKKWLFGSGLEQIGIQEISGNGKTAYYPFWQVVPRTDRGAKLPSSKPHYFLGRNKKPLSVKPGDFITAWISVTKGTYQMKMSDNRGTNNTIWTTPTVSASGRDLSNDSAEVVMEDTPGTPLADFGQAFFDGVYIDDNALGSTKPVEFAINPFSDAHVSPIGPNGDNFIVKYTGCEGSGGCNVTTSITSSTPITSMAGLFTVPKSLRVTAPAYTLAQIGLIGSNGDNTIELGWIIDPASNHGSDVPRLFIFFRRIGLSLHVTCQVGDGTNSCGSNFQSLTSHNLTDLPVSGPTAFFYVGYDSALGYWYIQYQDQYIARMSENWWTSIRDNFTTGHSAGWWGEVHPNGVPCTPMGNGILGTKPGSASITYMEYGIGGPTLLNATPKVDSTPNPQYWDSSPAPGGTVHANSAFHYGGPGHCL